MKDYKPFTGYKNFVGELNVSFKRTDYATEKISSSKNIFDFSYKFFEDCMDEHEEFKVLHLNNALEVTYIDHLSAGSDTGTVVDLKKIVRNCLLFNAKSIVLLHNHPSGRMMASDADKQITTKIKNAVQMF